MPVDATLGYVLGMGTFVVLSVEEVDDERNLNRSLWAVQNAFHLGELLFLSCLCAVTGTGSGGSCVGNPTQHDPSSSTDRLWGSRPMESGLGEAAHGGMEMAMDLLSGSLLTKQDDPQEKSEAIM